MVNNGGNGEKLRELLRTFSFSKHISLRTTLSPPPDKLREGFVVRGRGGREREREIDRERERERRRGWGIKVVNILNGER